MKIQVNGDIKDFDAPLTLAGLVERLGMKSDRVAIELNREIAPRDRWAQLELNEGDQLEIVHFVGGGTARNELSKPAMLFLRLGCQPSGR